MSRADVIELARAGWLTLCFMMLLSRVVFQAKGAVWMRGFLDGWQGGGVKRVWGWIGLVYGIFLLVAILSAAGSTSALDDLVLATLLAVLLADGLVNVLPAGFETFKDRMQASWVGRRGDRQLFGVVNAALALAAGGAAAAVALYKEIAEQTVLISLAVAAVVTAALIAAARAR